MRCLWVLLVSVAVVFGLVAAASGQSAVSADVVKDGVADLVSAVGDYGRSNPEAPGAFVPWTGGDVDIREPVLVHDFHELLPHYYLVVTVCRTNGLSAVATVDATSGEWQTYSRLPSARYAEFVDRRLAQSIATERLDRSDNPVRLTAVAMPNRRIYWRADHNGHHLYINLWNAADVRRELDAELTKEPHGIRMEADATDDPHQARSQETPPREPRSAGDERDRYPTSYDIASVPYYCQGTEYHCAPTALEMVFDYWGEHVNQTDIGRVANTREDWGTSKGDILRAAHFSYLSTAIQPPLLQGYDERALGYAAGECKWSFGGHEPDRYDDLKTLISSGYPVMISTRYSETSSGMHMRVVKGYDDSTNVFLVHDPWYGTPYGGPDLHFNQAFLVDTLWVSSGRWGMFAAPLGAELAPPSPMPRGFASTVLLEATYRGPHPFEGQCPASSPTAILDLSGGFSFAPGEIDTKSLPGIALTGSSDTIGWDVVAPCSSPPEDMLVQVYAYVSSDSAPSYPLGYTDIIAGFGTTTATVSTDPNEIFVDWMGAGDYVTIQEGIDGAPCDGDWVDVFPGTYSDSLDRDLDFGGKNLVLIGVSGPDETIIDCAESGRGLHFHSGEDTTSMVTGFTIMNGNVPSYGGGIYCDSASPRLIDLVLTSNTASYGGGVAWQHCGPVMIDVTISDNIAHSSGGGAYCADDTLGRLRRVSFENNYAINHGGGLYSLYSDNTLTEATFWGNSAQIGGGALLYDSSPLIESSLFWMNASGKGAALGLDGGSTPQILGSTVSHNNSGGASGAIECDGSWPTLERTIVSFTSGGTGFACINGGYPDVTHSCIYGNAGGDSLCGSAHHDNGFEDPRFCEATTGDFTLHDDSWCLPENNDWSELIGRYGAGGCGVSGIDDEQESVSVLGLTPASPNPSGGAFELALEIPDSNERLTVAVYSLTGRLVATLYQGPAMGSRRTLSWDCTDTTGRHVASGIYFVRAVQGSSDATAKIAVVR